MKKKKISFFAVIKDIPMWNLLAALFLLVSSLFVTGLISLSTKADLEAVAKQEFDFASNQIAQEVKDRFNAHAQILTSGAALFAASDNISRKEWQAFVQHLTLESKFPGIQGLGYAVTIPAAQLPEHLNQIRAEGFPDYKVWPQGERDFYTAIIYLEPFSKRNLRAFGYDMFTEAVRRTAMERARDSNSASLSGKVKLVQENGQDVQAGILLFVPVYQQGLPTESIAERRAALLGWVYSPYRMNDLMGGIIGDWGSQAGKTIRLEIFDGDPLSPDSLLYSSSPANIADLPVGKAFTRVVTLNIAGKRWNLNFTQIGTPASILDYGKIQMVSIGGTLISLLLFGLLLSWLTLRASAEKMAVHMTEELRASEEKIRAIINSADDIVFTLDRDQRFTGVYGRWIEKNGRTPEHFLGRTSHEILGKQDHNRQDRFEANQRALEGETADYEMVMIESELTRYFHMIVSPLSSESGEISGLVAVGREVTKFKQVEDALINANLTLGKTVLQREDALEKLEKSQVDLQAQNEDLHDKQIQLEIMQIRYFDLYDLAPVGYCTLDSDGLILEVNLSASNLLGFTRGSMINAPITRFVEKNYQDQYYFHRRKFVETGSNQVDELQMVKQDGTLFWAQVESSFSSGNKKDGQARFLISDISERKRIEQALAQTSDRLSLAVRAGGVGTWEYDIIHDRLTWDDQMYRLYGITPQDFSGVYTAWQQGLHPQDRVRGNNEIQAALRGEKDFDTEFRVVWPDGSVHNIHALALVQRDTAGEPLRLVGTNWDITDQKRMLHQLQISIAEKDALLREVHHRVKNNLAAIIGLISLQESTLGDDSVSKVAFTELGSRVSAMSLVHELLYSSESLVSIDFQIYLEKLTLQLSHLYQSDRQIQITVAATGVFIDLDEAIPCGLIVSEQITNSFKYAFPGDQPHPGEDSCKINISASQNGSAYTLTVSDNGVGLPVGFDWKKSPTLGLGLIRMLGEHQLGAVIQLNSTVGTCIELTFDKKHRSTR